MVAVRRADRDADHGPPRGQRPHVQPVAHDGALLADALHLPHRPQPPLERLRIDLRVGQRLPRLQLPYPAGERDARARAARRRLQHLLGRQEPQHAGRRLDAGLVEEGVAARPGLRPLLRLHRRRDQPVVSGPGRRQPLHGAAVPARGRLPPLQGPRRQGAALHPRHEAVRARQALVPVVLPGRQPRAPPRAAGVHRQVQGQVRRRLRGLPRVGAAAHDRARDPARGHGADADQPDARGHLRARRRRAAVGHAVRRGEGAVQPHGRGLRRLLGVHRPSGRPDRRLPRGVRAARQHDHLLLRRQRRLGRGQRERLGQRGQVLQRLPGPHRGQPADDRQARQPGDLQPLPDRLGGRVLHALPDVQALHVPGRHLRPAGDPLAEGDERARRGPRPVPPLDRHLPDDPDACGVEMPDKVNGVEQSPLAGVSMRYSFDAAGRADREEDAVLRDVRPARPLARRLEGGHRARPDELG